MPLPTQHRYFVERAQVDITLRLLKLRARTRTIRYCTGLSNDRIRRIFLDYGAVINLNSREIKRGKLSTCTKIFTRTAQHQLQATSLAMVLVHAGLFKIDRYGLSASRVHSHLEFGRRLCCAYETYAQLYPAPVLTIEHTWIMFNDVVEHSSLALDYCSECCTLHIRNLLTSERQSNCALCQLLTGS